ncbi:hypothetical protein LGM65_00335 [Burkholderia anthina]|uniref:hypothetical protein n=1 Tax=Burkholderia anthina TaxID=179879 RepID=UPI001CF12F0F|nr:hypothetical protein [Burkholderia anthina]MCA8089343.1 hypothetical protein [Burkholderia anthina]
MAYGYARIVVSDPKNLARFINAVFLAQGECRAGLPAEVRIGDSVVMVSGGDGLRNPIAAFLYVYVEDVDATYRRAVAARAVSLEAPAATVRRPASDGEGCVGEHLADCDAPARSVGRRDTCAAGRRRVVDDPASCGRLSTSKPPPGFINPAECF